MDEILHCHYCGDRIGVYEPMISIGDGRPHEISRAAMSGVASLSIPCYHRACFERMDEREELAG